MPPTPRNIGILTFLTIISEIITMTRRKSMADYAFPELHPEAALQEPSKNLLIYTQTGVDR